MLEQICYADQYLRTLIEARRLGVALLDLKGHILSSNVALQTLLGYSDEELTHQPFTRFLARCTPEAEAGSIASTLQAKLGLSEQAPSVETEIIRSSGGRVWVQLTLAIGKDEHQQPDQAIVFLEDLTETRQQQAQLWQLQKAIEIQGADQQEICLRNEILQSLEDVVWSAEPATGKTLYISPSAERVYGYPITDFFSNPDLWFEVIHPDDRAEVQALIVTLQQMGKVSTEYRIVRANGEVRWLFDRTWLIHQHTGRPPQLYGIISDITVAKHREAERKRAEAETLKALEQEKKLNHLKSRFVSLMTHEFRTPLSAILCAAELLEHYEHWTPAERNEQLQSIQTLVKHMSQLLEDVLLLGKTEIEHPHIQPVPINLVTFCNDLLHSLRLTVGKLHNLCFSADVPDRPIYLDEKLLRQILINLLSNAIKYSPQGGIVQLHLSYEGGKITFQVRDEGIGIPTEEQSHLFDFFYRATNVGAITGTGLGLAVVKQCVERQNGQITVTSQVGVGSTFTVTLPLSDFYSYS